MSKPVYWVTDDLYFDLKGEYQNRVKKYVEGDFSNYFNEWNSGLRDIGVTVDAKKLEKLNGKDTYDSEDAFIIFDALEGMTPALACRPNLWYYLVHSHLLEYSRKRWIGSEDPENVKKMVLLHFLVDTPGKLRDDHAASKPWWTYFIASKLAGTREREKVMEVLSYFGSPEKRMQTVERPSTFGDIRLANLLYNYVKAKPEILNGQEPFRELLKAINFNAQGFLFDDINEQEFENNFINI